MPPYEALYRKCGTPLCWYETGERQMLGSELVQQTAEIVCVIRTRLLMIQANRRIYVDQHRQNRDVEVGSYVLLRVSPCKGKIKFEKERKVKL